LHLKISDVLGQTVITWYFPANSEKDIKVLWDGTDEVGNMVSSGVYVCTAVIGDIRVDIKMIYLR